MKDAYKILFSVLFLALIVVPNVNAVIHVLPTKPLNTIDQVFYFCHQSFINGTFGVYKPDDTIDYIYQDIPCPFSNMDNKLNYKYEMEGVYSFWECSGLGCSPPAPNDVNVLFQVLVTEQEFQKDVKKLETIQNKLLKNVRALWNCVFNNICALPN